MSQELAVYNKIQNPIEAAVQLGVSFAKSGLFGCDRPEQGTILALECFAQGKSPMQICREYDIVDGKLRKKALAIFADFRSRGGKVKWIKTGDDGKEAEASFTFEDQSIIQKFTIEDAKKQGIVREKSAWVKTPGNMLRARVLSNAIAMLCPEIIAGIGGQAEDEPDQPQAEAKPLFPEKPATPSNVIDIEAEKVAEPKKKKNPDPVQPTPAPEPQANAQTEPQKAEFIPAVDVATGRLDTETVIKLQELIGDENADAAIKWLEEKKWIKPAGSLLDLSLERARKILNKPAAFLATVKGE